MDITSSKFIAKSINAMDVRLGMHGYVRADSEWKSSGMTIPYSKLYFVFSGSAVLECGKTAYELTPENVYLVPYGARHSFYCDGAMEKLYFHFTALKPGGNDIFENVSKIMQLKCDAAVMENLKKLYFSEDTGACFELKSELYSHILRFIKEFNIKISREAPYSETVADAIIYIRQNLSLGISVKQISDVLFVSESMLSKRFTKETGISIGKFVDREVMIEAQRRLLLSNEPIQQISEELGFCDQFYFSKKFKQFSGISPIKYRKQSRDGI